MNETKSSAAMLSIVVVVALVLIAVPCLLGALLLGGLFLWQRQPMPVDEMIVPQPTAPEPQVEPSAARDTSELRRSNATQAAQLAPLKCPNGDIEGHALSQSPPSAGLYGCRLAMLGKLGRAATRPGATKNNDLRQIAPLTAVAGRWKVAMSQRNVPLNGTVMIGNGEQSAQAA